MARSLVLFAVLFLSVAIVSADFNIIKIGGSGHETTQPATVTVPGVNINVKTTDREVIPVKEVPVVVPKVNVNVVKTEREVAPVKEVVTVPVTMPKVNVNIFKMGTETIDLGPMPTIKMINGRISRFISFYRRGVPNGNYIVRSPTTNWILDIFRERTGEGVEVIFYRDHMGLNQIFYFLKVKNRLFRSDIYILIARNSGKVVAMKDGKVVQTTYNGEETQQWKVYEKSDGYFLIENYGTGDVIRNDTPHNEHAKIMKKGLFNIGREHTQLNIETLN